MYKHLTRRIVIIIAVAVVALGVVAVLLSDMQTRLYQESYTAEMQEEFEKLPDSIKDADSSAEEDTKAYDETYQSLAKSVAYMANNDTGYKATDKKMAEYKKMMGVENVLIVKKDGTVVAKAQDTDSDYTSSRFNELRTVFDTKKPSDPLEVEVVSRGWLTRYYSARIDDETMVVLEVDPQELRSLIKEDGSSESVLKDIDIGTYGYMFSIAAVDYEVLWHPDDEVVGSDALADGIDVGSLENGKYSWMNFNGERLYCGVELIDGTYYVAAVPESEMVATRNITVAVILFAFLLVMGFIVMYGIFSMRENARRGVRSDHLSKLGPFRYNKQIAKRGPIVAGIGLIAVLVVTFFMQTLFALSSVSVSNTARVNDIVDTMDATTQRVDELTERYGTRYLPTCELVGYILDKNSSLENSKDLQKLSDTLGIENIYIYNSEGELTATDSTYTNYTLSDDPDDPSYEFTKMLQGGVDSYVADPETDETTGEVIQYIAVPLHDNNGRVDGLVQIAIRPTLLERFLSVVNIESTLESVNAGNNGMVFAVRKDDNTFAYWPPNPRYEDVDSVLDHGMTENELKDGYTDYLTIDHTTYYVSSAELSSTQLDHDYYVYLAGDESELMSERLPLTIVTGVVALICLIVIVLLIVFEPRRKTPKEGPSNDGDSPDDSPDDGDDGGGSGGTDGDDGFGSGGGSSGNNNATGVDNDDDNSNPDDDSDDAADDSDNNEDNDSGHLSVTLPSGRKVETESASSRWTSFVTKWGDMSAWNKTMTITRYVLSAFVVVVFLAVVFQDQVFEENSIFSYILVGSWERGLNIFAITACLMFTCVAATVVVLIQRILGVLSGILSARGETVVRMLSSFLRYGTVIGMIFYCLMLLGVDVVTLLASAGILALALTFGAQSLVADILSGLFIIFEGEFRVGDIIMVGDWRGTVIEVGIRTTKVEDPSQNVKVIRNSEVNNVINMTKKLSFVAVDVSIDYGESLERVEAILNKELGTIAEHLPAIVYGPYYRGVSAMGDNSVDLRITAQCAESDRMQLERDLNRELRLLFEQYDIDIPFPQVTVNEPRKHRKATDIEKVSARSFLEEQKEASKGHGDEDS